jgi:hypothetical protein
MVDELVKRGNAPAIATASRKLESLLSSCSHPHIHCKGYDCMILFDSTMGRDPHQHCFNLLRKDIVSDKSSS